MRVLNYFSQVMTLPFWFKFFSYELPAFPHSSAPHTSEYFVESFGCYELKEIPSINQFDLAILQNRFPIQFFVDRPFGHQQDGIRIADSFGGIFEVFDAQLGVLTLHVGDGDGVGGSYFGAAQEEHFGNIDCGGIPQVIGVGFEGQAEDGDGFAFEDFEFLLGTHDEIFTQFVVDLAGSGDDGHIQVVFAGGGDEGGGILAEAGATPADAGIQEARSDAGIQADAAGDLGDICADFLGQAGDFVDVGDFEGQEGVGGVFDHFGRGQVTGDEGDGAEAFGPGQALGGDEVLVEDRAVEVGEDVDGARVRGAEDDAVGVEGIVQGGTLAQEFRIRCDGVMGGVGVRHDL